uniref:Zinc finger protein 135-like n=1 Tax=Neolamprologus brichardi TaxID=32507 RepID=A0A3Q4GM86_NEOBR
STLLPLPAGFTLAQPVLARWHNMSVVTRGGYLSLRTPQSLEDHMRTHTGDRPFVCKDCGRRFVERSGWRQHMKIHTGEKPYKCQVCEKAFLRSHHLKCHLTTHSGKKEYSCSECGKEFGLKSSLDLHLRTHSSERPFHCNVCGKNFNTQRNLRVHTKLHTNEKAHHYSTCTPPHGLFDQLSSCYWIWQRRIRSTGGSGFHSCVSQIVERTDITN